MFTPEQIATLDRLEKEQEEKAELIAKSIAERRWTQP